MSREFVKRLIEVDLPIRRISFLATKTEKKFPTPRGHISTLHTWWARRPLAACRAVICAALWPDPSDPSCPESFRTVARASIAKWAKDNLKHLSPEAYEHFIRFQQQSDLLADDVEVRNALLCLIGDFASWNNSTSEQFLDFTQTLTRAAQKAITGEDVRPLVVDPFAGGGAIPLEAMRVGCDVFSSDLNPIAVMLNRIILEFCPRYGMRLLDAVNEYGAAAIARANEALTSSYGTSGDREPIAYLWARTIRCEGPACGAALPLLRTLWLSKKTLVALRIVKDSKTKTIKFEVVKGVKRSEVGQGTMKGGSATCPLCGYSTPNKNVRAQLSKVDGGADSATLIAVVVRNLVDTSKSFELPTETDWSALRTANSELKVLKEIEPTIIPSEPISPLRPSPNARGVSAVTRIGMKTFGDLFTTRQKLAIATFVIEIRRVYRELSQTDAAFGAAVAACLCAAMSKVIDFNCSLSRWRSSNEDIGNVFGRQALPVVWDFAETNLATDAFMAFERSLSHVSRVIAEIVKVDLTAGTVQRASATEHPLPNGSADALITDPPYYDSVPYADISDFFYVWHRRALDKAFPEDFSAEMTPKDEEAIWNPSRIYQKTGHPKDHAFYALKMQEALSEGARIVKPSGIAVVVFAHKSTSGWEAIIDALLKAGWVTTASWPIDTEMAARVNAQGTASLASSVHIVCRPRHHLEGKELVGEWREVLAFLPKRIHEWLPRLAAEGVVGADAIFACIGPALEIFSKFDRVEKASGELVSLKEYLEHVWAAVAKEALGTIFKDADASGFEEDARLTAMWLWTLKASVTSERNGNERAEDDEDEDDAATKKKSVAGFTLEYDAARKIAQGLGSTLESLPSMVKITGDTAVLLFVANRAGALFGVATEQSGSTRRPKKLQLELGFVEELEEAEQTQGWGLSGTPKVGETVLDRVHQCMLLFAAGRTEALKRLLLSGGVGQDGRFWRLAQVLSFLYPPSSDEKRWIDGVLARKKGLGF